MKQYKCPSCGKTGGMRSVETEIHQYPIFPNDDGYTEYDSNSKCIYGEFECIACVHCNDEFSESQLSEMVVDMEEEE
tara:strand:+ start:440 stop:670 length:231 start_codon:yes stop_codon:yes gene_type:complete